jgi:hypothetical protein
MPVGPPTCRPPLRRWVKAWCRVGPVSTECAFDLRSPNGVRTRVSTLRVFSEPISLPAAMSRIRLVTRPSMLSSRQLRPPRVGDEVAIDHARKLPLQTAHGLFVGLARFPLPIHVGLSFRHDPTLHQGDVVQGPVQLTVPAAVQPVSLDLPRGGRERSRAGQHGEGGLGPNSGGVAYLPKDLCGERSDARDRGEARPRLSDRGFDASTYGGDLPLETRKLIETLSRSR